MTLQRFLLILRARWMLVLGVLIAIFLLTLAINLVLPRKYVAEAEVLVDARPADPVLGAVTPIAAATSLMSTQADIILSDRVAQRAVTLLRLDQDKETEQRWRDATGGQGSLPAWIAASLKLQLKVAPTHESNVLVISYTARTPQQAAAVANAFAQAYLDTTLELKVGSAGQYAQWFDERTRSFRDKLEAAQQRLSAYQRTNRIVVADEKLDVETARLNELSSQLVVAQGQRAETRSRQGQAGSPEILPEVIGNSLIQGLKSRLAELESKRQQLALRVRENHPDYIDMMTDIAAVRAQLARETTRIADSLAVLDRMNSSREAEIRNALDVQKQKVLALRSQRDNVAVLQRDVETAQRDYDMVSQRLAQTSLESKMPQTNASMLTVATEPAYPSSPRVLLNTVLSVIFGGVLGVAAALLLEHFNRRIRCAADYAELLNLPVLAVLPSMGNVRRLPRSMEGHRGPQPPGRGGLLARLRDHKRNSSGRYAARSA